VDAAVVKKRIGSRHRAHGARLKEKGQRRKVTQLEGQEAGRRSRARS